MSCDINTYAGYHILAEDEISPLTNAQERLFWRQLAERYEREMRIMTEAGLFRNRVEHHTQMRGPELTADLLRLQKPILPHRWISYREGWCSAAWEFTDADLTPYALEEAAAKLVEEIRDPRFKRAMDAVLMPEGFTLGKECDDGRY